MEATAEILEITVVYLYKLCADERRPSPDVAKLLVEQLGLQYSDIYG